MAGNASSLNLIHPINTILHTQVDGKITYIKKTANDTWINMSNWEPLRANDARLVRMLEASREVSPLEVRNIESNKAVRNEFIGDMGTSPDHQSSPRRAALLLDAETTVESEGRRRMMSLGGSVANGTMSSIGMDKSGIDGKAVAFDMIFMDSMVGDRGTLDLGIQGKSMARKMAKYASKAIEYTLEKNRGRMQAEAIGSMTELHKYFSAISPGTSTPTDSIQSKEFYDKLNELKNQQIVKDQKGWLYHQTDQGLTGLNLVDTEISAADALKAIDGHINKGTNFYAYNMPFERGLFAEMGVFGDRDLKDMRGYQLHRMSQMFPDVGFQQANNNGMMFDGALKRLHVSTQVSKQIYDKMAKGFGSQFMAVGGLEGMNNVVNRVFNTVGKIGGEEHWGSSDNWMALDVTKKIEKLYELMELEKRGIYDPNLAEGMSVRNRFQYEILRQVSINTLAENDKSTPTKEVAESRAATKVNNAFDFINKEKAMSNKLEQHLGLSVDKSFTNSALGAFGGGTISSALAGAFLSTGIQWLSARMQPWLIGDGQKLEGINHTSFLTMINRAALTDFGSGPQFEGGGALRSATRMIGIMGSVLAEHAASVNTNTVLGGFNQAMKEIASGNGVLKSLDRGLAKAVYGTYRKLLYKSGIELQDASRNSGEALNSKVGNRWAKQFEALASYKEHDMKVGLFSAAYQQGKLKINTAINSGGGIGNIVSNQLTKLGSIFVNKGKLTGPGALVGLGIIGGILLNTLHGTYDADYERKLPVNDKVRNDPRFQDRKTVSVKQLMHDARIADMDGMPLSSYMREGLRIRMTDFGSSQADRGSIGGMVGEVRYSDSRTMQARQQILHEPIVHADMLTGGNDTQVALQRELRETLERPTLGMAEMFSMRDSGSFMGNERTKEESFARMTPDRSAEYRTGAEYISPKAYVDANQLTGANAEANAQRQSEQAVATDSAISNVDRNVARDARDWQHLDRQSANAASRVITTATPAHGSQPAKHMILDITDPSPGNGTPNITAPYRIPSVTVMPIPDSPNIRIVSRREEPITFENEKRKVVDEISKDMPNIEIKQGVAGKALASAHLLQEYMASVLREPIISNVSEQSMARSGHRDGTAVVDSKMVTMGGNRLPESTDIRVSPIHTEPGRHRQDPSFRIAEARPNGMLPFKGRDNELSNMMVNQYDRFSKAHLGYTGGGTQSVFERG